MENEKKKLEDEKLEQVTGGADTAPGDISDARLNQEKQRLSGGDQSDLSPLGKVPCR